MIPIRLSIYHCFMTLFPITFSTVMLLNTLSALSADLTPLPDKLLTPFISKCCRRKWKIIFSFLADKLLFSTLPGPIIILLVPTFLLKYSIRQLCLHSQLHCHPEPPPLPLQPGWMVSGTS